MMISTASIGRDKWIAATLVAAISLLVCESAEAQGGTVAPAAGLAFGNQTVTSQGAARFLTLTNTGGTPINVSALVRNNAARFPLVAGTCGAAPFSVGVGASCTLGVAFQPTSVGAQTGSISFTSTPAGAFTPDPVTLGGNGVAVSATLAPSVGIDFGSQTVTTTSAARSLTLTNTDASVDILVSSLTRTNPARYPVVGGSCPGAAAGLPPFTVPANSSCTIDVAFNPGAVGAAGGSITMGATTPSSNFVPSFVGFNGIGTAVPALLAPSTGIAFGDQPLGTTSAARTITLTNTHPSVAIGVDSIIRANSVRFPVVGGTCPGATLGLPPFTVPANSSCTLQVSFAPNAIGANTGSITIGATTPASAFVPDFVALSGNGTPAPPQAASEPLVFTTIGDGETTVVFGDPAVGLPTPTQSSVVMPAGARPHGVGFLSTDEVLVADFNAPRLFRIRVSTAQLVATLSISPRQFADGSIAVGPNADVAIASGEVGPNGPGETVVVRPPWGPGAQVSVLALPGRVRAFSTQAIAFTPAGRAFVCHTTGISAIDPPYTSIAFTWPRPTNGASNCVVSRDGQRLYHTRSGTRQVEVFSAPFTATPSSTTIAYPADAGSTLGALVPAPDDSALLIGQSFRDTGQATPNARIWVVDNLLTAPQFAEIALPASVTGSTCTGTAVTLCGGFEDASLNGDGTLAAFTGNSVVGSTTSSGRAPAVFVRHPFDAAQRAVFAVTVGDANAGMNGRGAGSVRFVPANAAIFRDGFETP